MKRVELSIGTEHKKTPPPPEPVKSPVRGSKDKAVPRKRDPVPEPLKELRQSKEKIKIRNEAKRDDRKINKDLKEPHNEYSNNTPDKQEQGQGDSYEQDQQDEKKKESESKEWKDSIKVDQK